MEVVFNMTKLLFSFQKVHLVSELILDVVIVLHTISQFMVSNMRLGHMTILQVVFLKLNLVNAQALSSGSQYSLGTHAWIQFRLGTSWSASLQATMVICIT